MFEEDCSKDHPSRYIETCKNVLNFPNVPIPKIKSFLLNINRRANIRALFF